MRREARTSLLFAMAAFATLSALLRMATGEEKPPALLPAVADEVLQLAPPPDPSAVWVHPGYRVPQGFVDQLRRSQASAQPFPAFPSTAMPASYPQDVQYLPPSPPPPHVGRNQSDNRVQQVWYQEGRYDETSSGIATVRDPDPTANVHVDINPDEAAKVIADLMESLGTRALQGTVFDDPAYDPESEEFENPLPDVMHPRQSAEELARQERREAIKQYVRGLAEEERQSATEERHQSYEAASLDALPVAPTPTAPEYHAAPQYQAAPEPLGDEQAAIDAIATLREVSRQLDEAAHQLENEDLYGRADQLRHLAAQLRGDARHAQGHRQIFPAARPVPIAPQRSLQMQIESLRREVRQLERQLPNHHRVPVYGEVR